MTEIDEELVRRLVVGRKAVGWCVYDPQAKAEIVRMCKRPGVSVAKIARHAGINANLLRTWMSKPPKARTEAGIAVAQGPAVSGNVPFVPLRIEAPPVRESVAMLRLHVRLPNGVEFDLGEAGVEALAPVLRMLGELRCSSSTTR